MRRLHHQADRYPDFCERRAQVRGLLSDLDQTQVGFEQLDLAGQFNRAAGRRCLLDGAADESDVGETVGAAIPFQLMSQTACLIVILRCQGGLQAGQILAAGSEKLGHQFERQIFGDVDYDSRRALRGRRPFNESQRGTCRAQEFGGETLG